LCPELPKLHTLNIAHRGARSLAPENTLAAARKALEVGADMWELDVRMTADGALILSHDSSLESTSNVKDVFPDRRPWRIQDLTSLQKLTPEAPRAQSFTLA